MYSPSKVLVGVPDKNSLHWDNRFSGFTHQALSDQQKSQRKARDFKTSKV